MKIYVISRCDYEAVFIMGYVTDEVKAKELVGEMNGGLSEYSRLYHSYDYDEVEPLEED